MRASIAELCYIQCWQLSELLDRLPCRCFVSKNDHKTIKARVKVSTADGVVRLAENVPRVGQPAESHLGLRWASAGVLVLV
jgi:hypothetical protein